MSQWHRNEVMLAPVPVVSNTELLNIKPIHVEPVLSLSDQQIRWYESYGAVFIPSLTVHYTIDYEVTFYLLPKILDLSDC